MPKKSTIEYINKKQSLHKARVTTFLRGSTKNKFFEEIKRTGSPEWELANDIIVKHYKEKESISIYHHKMKCE